MATLTATDLAIMIADSKPESASLELKRQLSLDTASQRTEAMKDLTGMGNGGGGTLLFEVDEHKVDGLNVASRLVPMTDRSITARLENLVRDTVRPPLLWQHEVLDIPNGFVLRVEVQRSPLGPYMVDTAKERRFYLRTLTATAPMSETQIRDAYVLSARGQAHRPELWLDHRLPLKPADAGAWLTISALPEAPLVDVIDLGMVTTDDLAQYPEQMHAYLNNDQIAGLVPMLQNARRWVHGIYSDDIDFAGLETHQLRISRDGAAAIGFRVGDAEPAPLPALHIARLVNAAALYLGWLWDTFDVRQPVEVRIRLLGLDGRTVVHSDTSSDEELALVAPRGETVDEVGLDRYILPGELVRAGVRHRLVRDFADRLAQATGRQRADVPFR